MAVDSNPNVPHMPPASTPDFVQGTPDWIKPIIQAAADKFGIPTAILSGLIKQESGFRDVTSPVGAVGYAQFMPKTAEGMGINPHDPVSAINGAAQYLSNAFKKFGKMDLAVASYNAGTGAIEKYQGIPPYKETQNYVKNVMGTAGAIHQSANGPTMDMIAQAKKMAQTPPQGTPAPKLPATPNYGQTTPNANNYNPQVSLQGQLNANAQQQTQMNQQSQFQGHPQSPPPQQFNVPAFQQALGGVGQAIGGAASGLGSWMHNLIGGK